MSTSSPMPPRQVPAVFCSNCGAQVIAGQQYCPKCAAAQPGYLPSAPATAVQTQYAGFWIRFAAWLLDAIIISVVFTPVQVAVFGAMGVSFGLGARQEDPMRFLAVMIPALIVTTLLSFGGHWLYEALMTSSSKQATIGKMACGLRVTDLQGRRLTFARATGRFFAKILSSLTLAIGYIIAGFTERKQALHDFVAGTYVLRG